MSDLQVPLSSLIEGGCLAVGHFYISPSTRVQVQRPRTQCKSLRIGRLGMIPA